MKYTFESASGIHEIDVTTKPANGDSSYTVYSFTCGSCKGGGLVKGMNVRPELVKWAKRMFIGYVSMSK